MKITLLEPYYTGSHASWADGLKAASSHDIEILSLKGQYWKWRMHGGAVTLARKFIESEMKPDLILATDMLDLTTFQALTRRQGGNVPHALYFHENQLSYPWSPEDRDVANKRDKHYGFINYSSALAADRCLFNSSFHKDDFLTKLINYLKHFPDNNELSSINTIEKKSQVLSLGLNLRQFDEIKPIKTKDGSPPLILWNHRWEYDKNPAEFFRIILRLFRQGIDFKIAILGENFSRCPEIFETAREILGDRVVQYGFVPTFKEYAAWLKKADILPVTSNHDFFGISIAEAVYCGTLPLLPQRLSYPEILPIQKFQDCFYDGQADLYGKLSHRLKNSTSENTEELQKSISRFDWGTIVREYDKIFEQMLAVYRT